MTNKKQICMFASLLVVGIFIWGTAGATANPAESFTIHPLREINLFLGRPLVCFSALGLLVLLIAKPLPEMVRKGSLLLALGMLAVMPCSPSSIGRESNGAWWRFSLHIPGFLEAPVFCWR